MLSLAVALTLRWPGASMPFAEAGALVLVPPLVVMVLAARGTYQRRLRCTVLDTGGAVVGAVSLAVMALVMIQTYVAGRALAGGALVRFWALSILFVHLGRVAASQAQRWARGRALVARRTLIVGAGAVGTKIARRLERDRHYGLQPIGFLDDDPPAFATLATDLPILGRAADLDIVARATGAEHVVLAFSGCPDSRMVPLVRHSKQAGLHISLVPRVFEAFNDRAAVEAFGGIPVLELRATDPLGWRFSVKHTFDRVGAATLLLLLWPLMLAIAAAVRISSGGPALFRQRRVGRDGTVFDLLKFRSMRPGDSNCAFQPPEGCGPGGVEGVDRRTALGRFLRRTCLDELPQLLNVLKGEMSLVGPRPERTEFVESFVRDVERYGDRHRVKAGITGLAQVHGLRGQTSIADRAELDNFYIENWSLKLDLRILAMTVGAVFRSADE